MKAFISLFLEPMVFAYVGVILGLFILIFKRRAAIYIILASLLQLWFFSLPPVAGFLAYKLEKGVPHYNKLISSNTISLETIDYLVVMGDSHSNKKNISPTDSLSDDALRRMTEAVRVMQQTDNAFLIVSGESGIGYRRHAEVLKKAAISYGVEESRIIINPNAYDTQSEIHGISKIAHIGSEILIISNAIHIPRVKLWAEHYGLLPSYAGVGYKGRLDKTRLPDNLIPRHSHLFLSTASLHEYFGIIYAYILIYWEKFYPPR